MTAHGTDPANVDEETFSDIAVMFHAGLIGNLGILEVLGTLTAGQFNKVLPKGKAGFTLKDIIPHAYDVGQCGKRKGQDKSHTDSG